MRATCMADGATPFPKHRSHAIVNRRQTASNQRANVKPCTSIPSPRPRTFSKGLRLSIRRGPRGCSLPPPVVHFQCPASPVGCRRLVGQKELTKFGGRVSRLLLIEGGLRSVSAAEEPVGSCTWLKAASRPLVGSRRAPLALLLGGIAFLFGRLVGATCRARARA